MKSTLLILSFALSLFTSSVHAAEKATSTPFVLTAKIQGSINPATSNYLKAAIRAAEQKQAQALVVELDTPGGLLTSVREMAQTIDQSKVPVIVYVFPAGASATSAGALLMLGSHVAAMAPGTNIGAAHPVGPGGQEIAGAMGEKATNDTAAFARGLATVRGRNVSAAEDIVSKSKSFTADEALAKKVIEILAPTKEELFRALHERTVVIGKETRKLEIEGASIEFFGMSPGQKLLSFLADPNIAGLLMSLGVLLIYVELSTPGITIPGVLGAICLVIAVMSFQLLPIRTGGIVLIIFGMLMMLAEPFVLAHGALALGGIIAFVLGLLWVVDPSSTSLSISPYVWIPIVLFMGGLSVFVSYAAIKIKRQAQTTLKKMGGGTLAGLSGYEGTVESTAPDGLSGKALFRGELWDFHSEQAVPVGEKVKVLRTEGMTVFIEKATD